MRMFLAIAGLLAAIIAFPTVSSASDQRIGSCIEQYGEYVSPHEFSNVHTSCRTFMFPPAPQDDGGHYRFAGDEARMLALVCGARYGTTTALSNVASPCRVFYLPSSPYPDNGTSVTIRIPPMESGGLY